MLRKLKRLTLALLLTLTVADIASFFIHYRFITIDRNSRTPYTVTFIGHGRIFGLSKIQLDPPQPVGWEIHLSAWHDLAFTDLAGLTSLSYTGDYRIWPLLLLITGLLVCLHVFNRPSHQFRKWRHHLAILHMASVALLIMDSETLIAIWRRLHKQHHGHCPTCNYNLTANTSGRCPECGTPISTASITPRAPDKTTISAAQTPST